MTVILVFTKLLRLGQKLSLISSPDQFLLLSSFPRGSGAEWAGVTAAASQSVQPRLQAGPVIMQAQ